MAKRQKESAEKAKSDQAKSDQKKTAAKKNVGGFDVGQIEILIGLMKENDLTEFELENGPFKIQLKRGKSDGQGAAAMSFLPVPAAPPPPAASAVSAPASEKPKSEPDEAFVKMIASPMVGTFYASPSPDKPPFVAVGDVIGPEKTVCIIEAMKVFNEIQGEMSGKIVAVLAKDGEAVEFGKPLFKIDTKIDTRG